MSIHSEVFAANRARGAVRFGVRVTDGVTRRAALHESGSLRVRFPTPEDRGLSAVFINTAGGIAAGDRFEIAIEAEAGARLTATTAAAEKVYRSSGVDSELDIRLTVAEGAHLAWLPQETILFDRARVARRFEIDLAPGASLIMGEIVVFGRSAMDERMREGRFVDHWRLRIGGRLVYAETTRLDGAVARMLAKPAIGNNATAIGTALIAPGDEALVERLRESIASPRGEVGISAWNGIAMARFCAQDAADLRADMMSVLASACGAPLPRLWLN